MFATREADDYLYILNFVDYSNEIKLTFSSVTVSSSCFCVVAINLFKFAQISTYPGIKYACRYLELCGIHMNR